MIRRISTPSWSVPIPLLAVTLAAYGLFATQQGYTWDDWGFAWVGHFIGKPGLDAYFAVSRPFWSNLFAVTTSFIGPNPLEWQIFGLLARWLMAVALWWTLRLIWKGHPRLVLTTTLLTLLYPGFSQHSIALVYGHYSLTFGMFFASLALGILALQEGRYRWLALAGGVVLSSLHIFSVEYYFGLELLRPAFMWVAAGNITQAFQPRLKRTLTTYIPFGLVLAAFGLWRSLGFKSTAYNLVAGQPAATVPGVAANAGQSIWNASVTAWGKVLQLPSADMDIRMPGLYAGLLLILAVGTAYYVYHLKPNDEATPTELSIKPFREWFIMGAAGVILAGIPFFIVNLPIKTIFPTDRFTQPFALGTGLILAALIELLPRLSWRAVGAGVLVALAVGVQIQYAHAFREDWRDQKTYFWQLTWRAPGLEPGTVVVSEDSPFRFTDDDALTFALNWLYDPDYEQGNLDYAQVFLSTRPGKLTAAGQPVEWRLLSTNFDSTTDSMIVIQYDAASCLRILHPLYDADLPPGPLSVRMSDALDDMGYPLIRQETSRILPLSNMNQVISNPKRPAIPPATIFGGEPAHQWCYFFEKADLARSVDDWNEVARLGDEAFSLSLRPNNVSEYLPFIEAYARLGRMKDAKQITLETARQMPVLRPALCGVWQRVYSCGNLSESDKITAREIQSSLTYCPVENFNE